MEQFEVAEDTRMELHLLQESLAELQVSNKPNKLRKPIGFILPSYSFLLHEAEIFFILFCLCCASVVSLHNHFHDAKITISIITCKLFMLNFILQMLNKRKMLNYIYFFYFFIQLFV